MLDRDGNVLASAGRNLPGELTSYTEWYPQAAAALEQAPDGSFAGAQGETHVYSSASVAGTDWQLVISASETEVFASLLRERRDVWMLFGAFGLLGLVLAALLARSVRRRRVAERRVHDLNVDLERTVEQRTAQLQVALRLAAITESAGEAIIGLDTHGRITSWNSAAEDLYGYDKDTAIGSAITLLTDGEHATEPLSLLRRALDGEPVVRHLTVRQAADGQTRTVQVSLAPLVDDQGDSVGAVAVHLDVTQLKDARETGQQALALFGSVFESGAPQGVTSLDGRILEANDAFCQMLGYDREQLVQLTINEVTDPSDRGATDGYFQQLRAGTKRTVQVRKRYRHRDGHVVNGILHLTRVPRHGEDDVLIGVLQDITELTVAQEQLAQREALLRAVTSSSANSSTMYDTAGRCVFADGAGLGAIGETPEGMVGSYFVERYGDDPKMLDAFRRALSGEPVDVLTELRGRSLDIRFRAVENGNGPTGVALAVTDVTERFKAAGEREAHAAELEAVNQELRVAMGVREHILSATTHELRTPLTPMVGMLELISRRWDDLGRDTLKEYFDVLHRNTGRLTTLVEDLLVATSLRSGPITVSPEAVDARGALRRVLARFPETADAVVTGPEVAVWCKPEHLDQMLTAVVSNAAKYGAPTYRAHIDIDGRTASIAVTDEGPGIPEEEVELLFEPFQQGSVGDTRTATRLGLGLPIARALAEAHGGRLVYRRQLSGAAFTLTLLTAPGSPVPAEVAPQSATS